MRHNIIFLFLFSIFLVACGDNPETISDQTEQTNAQETAAEQAGANSDAVQSDELAVHFIDVGQADATLFHYKGTDSQYAILYDVGDWQGDEMVPYLQKESIDFIDLIIISHPHADHIGQLDSIMDHFDAGEVWMSGNAANTDLFQDAMEAVLESDADYDEPKAGAMYDIGPLELAILHPETLSGDLNEDSLSVRFTYGNVSFLFTGDAYQEQENEMIGRGIPLEADVLQLGHHGSDTSNDPLFIDAVNPAYAIYSAGAGNAYGHPHEEIVQYFASKEIDLFGTDIHGTVTVTTDGKTIDIQTEKASGPNSGRAESATEKSDCININNASKEELMEITQIGEARAKDIIDLRPFSSIDDLKKVNGIGDKRIQEIKQQGIACTGGD